MLHLHIGFVADAHRLVAEITMQVDRDLFNIFFSGYAIQWLQRIGIVIADDILDEIEIFFQLFEVTDLVEGFERIVGIAEPAITVIPVAGGIVEFRKTGSARRR